jgi:superfamily II RNA helicase
LSATLAGTEPFARWIAESKGIPLWLISTVWRAVPLYHHIWCSNGGETGQGVRKLIKDAKEAYYDADYSTWLNERRYGEVAADAFKQKVKDARRAGVEGPISGKTKVKSFEYQLNQCVNQLAARGELPAICFLFSRKGCESAAAAIEGDFLDSSDAATVAHIWDFHLSRFSDSLETMASAHTLRRLAQRGIAFHHSGLVPFLKEILEILFSKGLVKLLFATETFAVGINMPTKTVIFTGLEKYDSERGGFRVLRADEYIQMAGRAGRRGKDDRGIVIYLPQRAPLEAHEMRTLMTGGAARVTSRMTFDYDFILKTLQNPAMEWKALMKQTYWRRLLDAELIAAKKDIEAKERELTAFPLSEEHRLACEALADIQQRIAVSGNSAKKKAQKELVAWEAEHDEKHWAATMDKWRKWACLKKDIDLARREVDVAELEVGADLRTRLQILEEYGYVEKAVGDDAAEKVQVTARGRLASEINEGQPLLMTEMFMSGVLKPMSLEDQLITLAAFLGEASMDDYRTVYLDDTQLTKEQKEVLRMMDDKGQQFLAAEQAKSLPDSRAYWKVSYEWVDAIRAWLEGWSLSQIAAEYELFEGNVQRAVLKLASLAEEWIVLLTLSKDVEQLRVWMSESGSARERILRDIVVAESLYLRL